MNSPGHLSEWLRTFGRWPASDSMAAIFRLFIFRLILDRQFPNSLKVCWKHPLPDPPTYFYQEVPAKGARESKVTNLFWKFQNCKKFPLFAHFTEEKTMARDLLYFKAKEESCFYGKFEQSVFNWKSDARPGNEVDPGRAPGIPTAIGGQPSLHQ